MVIVVSGEDHNPNAPIVSGDLTSDVDPTSVWEPNIDENDIRMEFANHRADGISFTGLAYDDDVFRRLEDVSHADSLQDVIIDDENLKLAIRAPAGGPAGAVEHASNLLGCDLAMGQVLPRR
jgi:hypothetical protein